MVQMLDDKNLSLVMRDARENGKYALEILREHLLVRGIMVKTFTSWIKSPYLPEMFVFDLLINKKIGPT